MTKEKLWERCKEGNSDDNQRSQTECDDHEDFLDGKFYRSREFWMKVTIQGNPNHSKFLVTHNGLNLLLMNNLDLDNYLQFLCRFMKGRVEGYRGIEL